MTHVDPVCGMTIEAADAAGTHQHDGVTYYFCNPSCLERFKTSPKEFLESATTTATPAPAGATFLCPMDPDVRASRDLLQRRRGSVLGECVARGGDQLLVVSQRVGPLRARRGEVAEGVGGAHGANSWIPLTNRR